jgi:hypothetical protein
MIRFDNHHIIMISTRLDLIYSFSIDLYSFGFLLSTCVRSRKEGVSNHYDFSWFYINQEERIITKFGTGGKFREIFLKKKFPRNFHGRKYWVGSGMSWSNNGIIME